MHSLTLLVVSLFLTSARFSPLPNSAPIKENADASFQPAEVPAKENVTLLVPNLSAQPINENLPPERSETDPLEDPITIEGSSVPPAEEMTGQETFYPVVGIWWGGPTWGGWGYRPGWHGWYRPWYRPQWGGNWGGRWRRRRWG